MKSIAAAILFSATSAFAQPYVGVRFGVSSLDPNISGARFGHTYHLSDNRTITNLYVGYTRGDWSVEIGGGSLARRHSHNISATYDIVQDISADHLYGAVLRHWRRGDLSAHAMLGAARVMFKNHEYGSNETGPNVTQLNYGSDRAPIYGFGLAYRLGPRLTARMDAVRIDRVIRSHWTRPHSDITLASAGLHYHFR